MSDNEEDEKVSANIYGCIDPVHLTLYSDISV